MCCRYYYDQKKANRILEELHIDPYHGDDCPDGEITPGSRALMITGDGRRAVSSAATWGFPNRDGRLVINGCSETVSEKHMFAEAAMTRRCLLPAEHFYEWDRDRNRVTFYDGSHPVIFLAGLWSIYNGAVRFVVLTTAANESMKPVHDRMPLMIAPCDIAGWLSDTSYALGYHQNMMPHLETVRENEQMKLFV